MKYIVAGGLGFIGSEVCRQLLDQTKYPDTEKVWILDDDSKGYGTTKINDLLTDERLQWFKRDLTNVVNMNYSGERDISELVAHLMYHADYVINCAAKIGGIGYFNKIPAQILRNNNLIQSNLLDEIVQLPHKQRPHFVQMSSSMVFESATEFPSKESDLAKTVIPVSAYGFSKLSSEFYCKAFAQEYDVRYTIVRPFNAVGPEKPDPNFVGYSHVLPDLVCKIKNGQGTADNKLQILGTGQQVRHYTDVKEVAEGILIATHSPKAINEDFNIAISKGHTVAQVASLVWNSMRRLGQHSHSDCYMNTVEGFAHDVLFRSPDTTKAKELLGWEAKTTLDDNIDEIVESVLKLL